MSETSESIAARLNDLLASAGLAPLEAGQAGRFESYLALLLRWNARVNLTAIRDQEGILSRHFVESIACARALPDGIDTLLDFGSGAGFPGIPIALCRPEIAVTLAESQGKKAAFLREVVRQLGLSTQVHSGRAETLTVSFDCITLRAVDRMEQAIRAATPLVKPAGWLAPMTTSLDLAAVHTAAGSGFLWSTPIFLPGGHDRVLMLGQKLNLPV